MQGWERVISTLSVQRPQPTIPTYRQKEDKIKKYNSKRDRAAYANEKSIGPAHETRHSDTDKGPSEVQCSAARRRIKYTYVRPVHRV